MDPGAAIFVVTLTILDPNGALSQMIPYLGGRQILRWSALLSYSIYEPIVVIPDTKVYSLWFHAVCLARFEYTGASNQCGSKYNMSVLVLRSGVCAVVALARNQAPSCVCCEVHFLQHFGPTGGGGVLLIGDKFSLPKVVLTPLPL